MKRKNKLSSLSRHVLTAGLLFPAAVCLTYVIGILTGGVPVDFRYDARLLIIMTAEIYAASAVVAISCAFLAEWLYRRAHS